jgi:hypothetical protein
VEIGTEKEDFVRLSQRIGRSTGGIRPASITALIRGTERSAAWLCLRGKAMASQADELLAILGDVLLTVRLDNQERFRQMVLEEKAEHESSLVPNGHAVVNTRLRSLFNEAGWADEQMSGVDYLFFLRRLAEAVETDWPGVLEKLEAVKSLLVSCDNMLCNVTLDEANWSRFQPQLVGFLEKLPLASVPPATWQPGQGSPFEGLTIPAQVNYVGKGTDLYRLGYQAHGSISVIIKYLQTTWLWERVRVQGGAYGGFCLFDHRSGVLTYISYRDPNLVSTLENYDLAAQFLRQLDSSRLSHEELTKSIIGTIGDMDTYQLPDAKGWTSMLRYLTGDTDEKRQLWREQILSTQLEDFCAFGEVLEGVNQKGSVVVLGSQDAIEKANAERRNWLEVKKVL